MIPRTSINRLPVVFALAVALLTVNQIWVFPTTWPTVAAFGNNALVSTSSTVRMGKLPKDFVSRQSHQMVQDENINWNDAQLAALEATKSSKRAKKKELIQLPFSTGVRYLMALSIGRHPQYTRELVDKYRDSFIIWNKYITLAHVDEIRDVLEGYNLEKPDDVKEAFKVVFFPTGGILSAEWEDWKQQRRMTAPSLSEVVIGQLTAKFEIASRPFFQILETAAAKGEVLEMDEVFVALTMDTIGLILLGRTFGLLDRIQQGDTEPVPFLQALTRMGTEATRQSALPRWVLKYKLWRPSRKVREAKQIIDNFLEACIEDRLKNPNGYSNGGNHGAEAVNLLNILLDAEAEGTLSRDSIKGQLLTFIFAGYDTTAHTMCFMLYEASKNSTLQQDLETEASVALPQREEFPLDLKLVNDKMKLMERVWMETLRIHPAAASGTSRVTGDEAIIVGDGLELPKNKYINMSPYVIQHDERYWPNPTTFDPSRFEPEAVAQRESCSLLTFSAGPRNCLGSRLARAEALTVMTSLFRRFHVTCVETEEIQEQTLFTTRPKDGIRFQFQVRN